LPSTPTISWYLSWPVRCLIRSLKQRSNKSTPNPRHDEEVGIPLIHLETPPNPYAPTTSRIRRPRHRSYLMNLFQLLNLIAITHTCSNFAMLSASTTECDYTREGQRTCWLRINTRLAISPIGQKSCLRLDDSRSGTLGTITIQTQAISVRCKKELLYYIPRASTKCDSSRQCFNILRSHECTYDSCANFNVNSTIAEFGHTTSQLGWSSGFPVLPGCFWPSTHDCHFARSTLINATGQTHTVFSCPEWTYATTLVQVQLHLGGNVTTNAVTLYVGKTATVHEIELSLVSATMPPTPLRDTCVLTNDHRIAITPCNKRGELTTNRIGEIQCNSIEEAQTVDMKCMGSHDLI
jgi:hypothetical protein